MNSRQRAYLIGLASNQEPILQIGKNALSPQVAEAVRECFNTHELIKINVLKNCMDDLQKIARVLSERTGSEPIKVIGRKIILYKENKDNKKIELPK